VGNSNVDVDAGGAVLRGLRFSSATGFFGVDVEAVECERPGGGRVGSGRDGSDTTASGAGAVVVVVVVTVVVESAGRCLTRLTGAVATL
jgi:hypothetical protein